MGTPMCLTQRREDAKVILRQGTDHRLDSVVSFILASWRLSVTLVSLQTRHGDTDVPHAKT